MTTETTTTDAPEESTLNRLQLLGEGQEGQDAINLPELKFEAGENEVVPLMGFDPDDPDLTGADYVDWDYEPPKIPAKIIARLSAYPEDYVPGLQNQIRDKDATIAAQQQRIDELRYALDLAIRQPAAPLIDRLVDLHHEVHGNCGNCKHWRIKSESDDKARGVCDNTITHELIRPRHSASVLVGVWKLDPTDAEEIADFCTMNAFRCNQWEQGRQQFPLSMVDEENTV